jgi:hypothetical protein
MLIGLLSDSHDNFPGLLEAVEIFKRRGVEMILHAGDVVAPGMCYAFEGWAGELFLVFGNNDGDRIGLKRDFGRLGVFLEISARSRQKATNRSPHGPTALVRGWWSRGPSTSSSGGTTITSGRSGGDFDDQPGRSGATSPDETVAIWIRRRW